jgi:hypothetical protein
MQGARRRPLLAELLERGLVEHRHRHVGDRVRTLTAHLEAPVLALDLHALDGPC